MPGFLKRHFLSNNPRTRSNVVHVWFTWCACMARGAHTGHLYAWRTRGARAGHLVNWQSKIARAGRLVNF